MTKRQKIAALSVIILLTIVVVTGFIFRDQIVRQYFQPTETTIEEGIAPIEPLETVAQDLEIPWEIAFLPNGDLLVTERSGTLRRLGDNEEEHPIRGVEHVGEGGLLGLALHPDFSENHWLYLYSTTRTGGAGITNRVERYTYQDNELSEPTLIIDGIPGASNHNGGRIAFGPDGYLYITTGDAAVPQLSQDTASLAGKILRLTDEGEVPTDNPFNNPVYSLGHRNPQGLAWDANGRLWATEHGPIGFDELNLIEAGNNYGWPQIRGDETAPDMQPPIAHSGPDDTWAPSGLAFVDGALYFAGLRGNGLYEARIGENDEVNLRLHLRTEYGRLRAVVVGPDNLLYISTSNRDGRGSPDPADDRVIKIDPRQLNNTSE